MLGVVPFTVFATEGMLGEVKQARNFRKLSLAFVGGAVYVGLLMAVLWWLLERTASTNFLSALSFDLNKSLVTLPYGTNITNFAVVLNNNLLIVIAITAAFMVNAIQLPIAIQMNITRVFVSMGLDRALPGRIATVSERLHTPVVAATVYLVFVLIMGVFFTYATSWFTAFTYVAAISGEGVLLFGSIAALLLPWRASAIYKGSPVSVYRAFGIPLVSVAGALGLLFMGASWIVIMTDSRLGIAGVPGLVVDPRILVIAPVVVGLILFYIWQLVERGRGVDTSLAYKAVPPE